MSDWKFTDSAGRVVSRTHEDGRSESVLASALPQGTVILPADAPTLEVPQSVTRFQALAALHLAGHLPAVQDIMASPETPVLAKLAWDNALSFERSSPTLATLAEALGLTDADLDALFISASGIAA